MSSATATRARTTAGVGPLLREWRQQRHLSQLDLAGTAEVSTKHLSFVETGRAKPSRELVLHLAEHLEVPLRERNTLLLAAGYAPVYQQSSLDSAEMTPVRDALDRILASHEPFPAIVVDRRWDLVAANRPALAILTTDVDPALLAPPANALRISLHPDGLAPRITNLAAYGSHILTRLHRQAQLSADPALLALGDELRSYPGIADVVAIPHAEADDPVAKLFVPLAIEHGGQTLTFFSTMSTFGTALDVTVAELSIESFFPADAETAAALRATVPDGATDA